MITECPGRARETCCSCPWQCATMPPVCIEAEKDCLASAAEPPLRHSALAATKRLKVHYSFAAKHTAARCKDLGKLSPTFVERPWRKVRFARHALERRPRPAGRHCLPCQCLLQALINAVVSAHGEIRDGTMISLQSRRGCFGQPHNSQKLLALLRNLELRFWNVGDPTQGP